MNRFAPATVPPVFQPPLFTPRILCAWLRQWPLQRLVAARGELSGRAVLIYQACSRGNLAVVDYWPAWNALCAPQRQSRSDGLSHVAAATTSTGTLPVAAATTSSGTLPVPVPEPGMPLAEALALHQWSTARRTPRGGLDLSLHLEAHDLAADRLALVQLAQACQKFSPLVGLPESEQPECLLLDIGRVSERFGGERPLAQQLAHLLAERGFWAHLAVGDSVAAAWALAHYARGQPLELHGETSPGEQKAIRRGVTTLTLAPPGHIREALGPLPIAALRLDDVSLEYLAQLGVERIEQLAALPRAGLAIRFGPALLRRLDQALADANEVIVPCRLPAELEASWVFESPTARREEIEYVLAELLPRLVRPLSDERRGVLELAVRLQLPAGEPCRLTLRLFRPTVCYRHLVEMFRLRLETLRLRQPIAAIHLAVTASDQIDMEQQTLFDVEPPQAQPRRLAQAIDRLTQRLSREAVLRPVPLADAQPEYACQYLPLGDLGRRDASSARFKNRPMAFSTGERPTWLFTPAIALRAVTVAPDGLPATFDLPMSEQHAADRFAVGRQRIAWAWGPERIETGWWRSRRVRRDYYRVETTTAQRYWLFRCLRENRWFLQGAFD